MVHQHRRNFLPAFITNTVFWAVLILIVLKLPPNQSFSLSLISYRLSLPINLILFFFFLTLSLGLTLALVFGNTRRGFFLTLFFDVCLLLRLIKQATWLNFFLLLGLFLTSEFYFLSRGKSKSRPLRKIRQ